MSQLTKILHFASEEFTPFAPYWDYFIAEGKCMIDLNPIEKEILGKEKEIIEKYEFEDDWGTKLGKNSLTARSKNYNLLEFDSAETLRFSIKDFHDKFLEEINIPKPPGNIYVQCWANVMRKKQRMAAHRHNHTAYSYLSGHLCVKVKDTSTYYHKLFGSDLYDSPNSRGKMTMFPSWVMHHTDAVVDDEERITIAFDIMTEEGYIKNVSDSMKHHWVAL
jgi:hypothetical protein